MVLQAIEELKRTIPTFHEHTGASYEELLLRSLLNRVSCRITGDDGGFDYWGIAAKEYAEQMLAAEELPTAIDPCLL